MKWGNLGYVLILIRTPLGPAILSLVEVVLFHRCFLVLSACPLLGDLSSFGVSFIGGFTFSNFPHLSNNQPEMLLIYDFYYEHSKLSTNILESSI